MKRYFNDGGIVECIPAEEVVKLNEGYEGSRLFLPPIQRSVVWSNAQIINYWDSLLRGYPAGTMMVHRSRPNSKARTFTGQTTETGIDDFSLFDGQQRLTAILLGHASGQLNTRLKLWVDLGVEARSDSGLLFQLRINSTGQPFGYQVSSPNEKMSLGQRSKKIEEWKKDHSLEVFDSDHAFNKMSGRELIDSKCPFPLHKVISHVLKHGAKQAIDVLKYECAEALPGKIESFVDALGKALKQHIIFQLIDDEIIRKEGEYIRYFGRLGQGGTKLTDDELTYSIIKHQYPQVHDRMVEITEGKGSPGRIASEVNLVLASLRLAKVISDWDGDVSKWHIIARPNPSFVSGLKELPAVLREFEKLIPDSSAGRLLELLGRIRERLDYEKTKNPNGLPLMLLARLPHQLVDVLLLMQHHVDETKQANPDILSSFVLYWLLFVIDSDKAARLIFQRYRESEVKNDLLSLPLIVQEFEKNGISWRIPRLTQLPEIRKDIENGNHHLRYWEERFASLDTDIEKKSGDSLRELGSNPEKRKRALLWLQREYLSKNYSQFDPTSNRDEDLPVDLDHLIPNEKFGFNWKSHQSHINFDDVDNNFRRQRGLIGNSIGNFRWLDASENRSRGDDVFDINEADTFFVNEPEKWISLIEKNQWDNDDLTSFQKIIDLRTIELFEKILVDGRLELLISEFHPENPSTEV